MGTTNSRVKGIRLPNDVADWLEGKDSRLILESCCELIRAGKLKLDDSGVHTVNEKSDVMDDIEQMVRVSGGTLDDFLQDLDMKIGWGELELQDGVIRVEEKEAVDMSKEMKDLQDACNEKGVDINEAIRKTAQSVWGIRQ